MILGYMISFETWEKYIRLSGGSDAMKEKVIAHVIKKFGEDGKSLEYLDSFLLGYSYSELQANFTNLELVDFYATIYLTRDQNNVPIVKYPEQA